MHDRVSGIRLFENVVIPLTHHKNSGYTELKVFGVYPFVYRIFSWCTKGIVTYYNSIQKISDCIKKR
ncbi:MAG: hypothetical protein E7493_13525 [Ruminococcus albus]|nr:hypothetical protein [Ruminococcus albus]